jgi:prolyl oligopeptidase
MRRALLFALVLTACAPTVRRPSYPPSFRGPDVDNYHGTFVEDPYRWLEDPDSPDTKAWVDAQNALTFGFLGKIPERAAIRARLEEVYGYERRDTHQLEGGRLFYQRNTGLQNQSVLWVAAADGSGAKVLLDPNTLSSDGTVALSDYAASPDGKWVAWSSSSGGSDWQEWRVREVATGKDLPDVVRWSKFSSAVWMRDSSGFFYARYPEPAGGKSGAVTSLLDHQIYLHKLRTQQAADVSMFRGDPSWINACAVTVDGKWLVVASYRGSIPENLVTLRSLADPSAPPVALVSEWKGSYSYVGGEGDALYFQTDVGSPRGRVIRMDPAGRETTLVPEGPDAMQNVALTRGRILVQWMHDAASRITVHDLEGKPLGEVDLPPLVAARLSASDLDKDTALYGVGGYVVSPRTYRWDVATGKSTLVFASKVPFDESAYETVRVFYPGKDGTKIPMFLTQKKGTPRDGTAPTYLYAYGGFAVSMTPYFWPDVIPWLERGGVYAVANIRGGGEYGEAWHEAGMLGKKQTVFDDFLAAADWLVAEKVTSRARLAIGGGSNGGLLVGAVITQRPDAVGAAVAQVGVMDMLRYHRFTIGRAWASEYGSADDPEQFKWLKKYSPLHNVKMSSYYPPTLLTTGDHDDRVVPAHSYKLAAAMQTAQASENPILIRIQTKTGHGAGKPLKLTLDESADIWAFIVEALRGGG